MEIEQVREKVFEGRPGFPREYGPDRTDRQPGYPFWPHEVYRDLVIILLMTGILFVLSAAITPPVGPAKNPTIQPFIVPDWYLLFSWGLLKIAEILPTGLVQIPAPFGPLNVDGAFWGDVLTAIPIIPLFLLPFVDKGREERPAKAPVRSALGIFLIAWIFSASFYAINNLTIEKWPFLGSDDTLKWFFVIPPVLTGVAAYVGLRRLGYREMYWWRVIPIGIGLFLLLLQVTDTFLLQPLDAGRSLGDHLGTLAQPQVQALAFVVGMVVLMTAVVFYAVTFLDERRAKALLKPFFVLWLVVLLLVGKFIVDTQPSSFAYVLFQTMPSLHLIYGVPIFVLITAAVGLREPYSAYEYLLNECYQCGKCHTACPVTKVEDDALGGLNLVYNTFKKQHDGVPLWTCLACDACSAVCPLDIQYSDYILEERAKGAGAPQGGEA
ncbi:MAG TPA: 4Fe-4S dicluster domain-containing protein [Thermoplasmata archaeon]|nr:4Fe-4S dicluster domain-containing protein [Thermoplasmata archaeon]